MTYDQKPFTLDGQVDLEVSFEGTTMKTPVYVKLYAAEPLLLSEGVCRQLGIISYHLKVLVDKNGTLLRGMGRSQVKTWNLRSTSFTGAS